MARKFLDEKDKMKHRAIRLELSNLSAIIGYTFLTLILTYPLIFKIGTHVMGSGGDARMMQNFLWWFDKAIFELGVNPLYSDYLNYPIGIDIYLGTFIGLVLAPITHVFGVIASYNIYVLSTFILSGFGTYLLVKYLTNNTTASFIAGIIYAFSPFHFAHAMGHLHIMSIQWIPFYILFLMKMIKDKNRLDTCLCAIFFSLTALSSWTFGIYLAIFSLLYVLYIIYTDRSIVISYDFLKKIMTFSFISILLCTPFAMVLIRNMLMNPLMYKPLPEFINYSADFLSFFIPSPYQTISGGVYDSHTGYIYSRFTGNRVEQTTYLRYTVLVLALYAIWKIKEKKIKFFALSAIIFFVLSLGPILHIYGQYQFTGYNITFTLPYLILYYLPITSMARAPARCTIMVILMLSILVGYAIPTITKNVKNTNRKQFIFIAIIVIILIESMCFPVRLTEMNVPDFYYQLRNDKNDYAIMEIPLSISESGVRYYIHSYAFYQTVHGKKLLGPVGSREYISFKNFMEKTPVLRQLVKFDAIHEEDILHQNESKITNSILNYYDVKYVIIHYNLIKKAHLNNAKSTISQIFGTDPYFEKKDMVVYKIEKDKDFIPFMTLGNGWHEMELRSGIPSRWMENNGTIKIISERSMDAKLSFTATPFYKPRSLQVFVNDEFLDTYHVNGTKTITTQTISLLAGENLVLFYAPEGTDKPSECLGTEDRRDISVAFQNIKLIY